MSRLRAWSLPLFLTLLALVVAGAVVARMRAYEHGVAETAGRRATETSGEATTGDPVQRSRGGTIPQLEPAPTQSSAPSDPGVIVETSGDTTSTNAAASRAQRFKELLTAPLPSSPAKVAPPAPAPVEAPVVVAQKPEPQPVPARVVVPIGTAIRKGAASSATAKSVTSSQQAPLKEQTPSRENGLPGQQQPTDPAAPNDKTSDSRAPILLGAEFAPPLVQDGQDAMLIIAATDDLSGIRNISGSVTSPTGKALQGFAAQREGETQRFIGRIQIPRDAEEGSWRINFLSLSDNASNTVNLTFAQSGLLQNALLRVQSSRPDSTPPVVKNVWLDRRAMTAGEKNTVFVQVIDDKSGVQLVTGVLLSPTGLARLGFGCRATENDVWACDVATPKKVDCGEWKLEQLQLQDKANNMGTERGGAVAAVRLGIMSEACDSTPPEMRSFMLDPTTVGNSGREVIHVTAVVTDDNSGVASISGQAIGPTVAGQQPPRAYFSLRPAGDGQTWTGDLVVPELASKGTWSVISVQVLDDARNMKSYSRGEAVLANGTFTVR